MRLTQWLWRPQCLAGIAGLLVIAGLALGIRALWNAARAADHLAEGRVAVEQGDVDKAWHEFSEAVRLAPLCVEARRERARLAIGRNRWDEAIADLDAALQCAADDAELYALRAEVHVGIGRDCDRPDAFDRAIADADEALRLDPNQALAYCQRALANSGMIEDEKALADTEAAVQLRPDDARVFVTRGRVRAARAEDDKAITDFSEAIRRDPKHARAYALRGVSRFKLHEDAAALADCNRAVELAPRDSWVYCCRARVYREDRRYAKELADLDQALELNPRDVFGYFERAACRLQHHDIRRAASDCAAALAINPQASLVLAVRAVCHLERGRKKRAAADMEKAVQLRRKSALLRILSAAFYHAMEAQDTALAECALALKGGNDHTARIAYRLRAATFLCKGDVQRALADCDRILKLDPKCALAYAIRSAAYTMTGDADRSRAEFDAALRLDRVKAYLLRAEIFDVLRLNHEAIADWTELLKINPEEADVFLARAAAYLAPVLEPAIMGVAAQPNALIISALVPDLPAAKAGVQVGDRITRVGTLQPTQFNQVVEHVATFRRGATLEMEIERDGERHVFRLVLAARPSQLRNPNQPGQRPQVERAIGDCQRGIALDPEIPALHRLLAEAYDLLDRHDEAIASATEALRLDPEDPLAHLARARSYLARNEGEKAIADANAALRLEAEGGMPYLLRGLAYAAQNKVDQARADLAEAARLDPRLANVREEYEKLLAQKMGGQNH